MVLANWGPDAVLTRQVRAGFDMRAKAGDPAAVTILCMPGKSAHAADDADLFEHFGKGHGCSFLVLGWLSGKLFGIISVRLT